jgi:seryl-tRNA(Sec) selenium transferase
MHAISSVALAIRPRKGDANTLAARLRAARPPVIGRAVEDRLSIDLRTIPPDRDSDLTAVLRRTI